MTPCSHALLTGGRCSRIIGLSDHVGVLEHGIMGGGERVTLWDLTSAWVRTKRPSEEENEGLGLVDFVVDPAAGLLDAE